MSRSQTMGAQGIYEALKSQILGGVFGISGRLPSSRSLALELGVSRSTVTVAYEQLLAEGFVEIRQGSRPRVASAVGSRDFQTGAAPRVRQVRLSAYGRRLGDLELSSHRESRPPITDFRHSDLARSDFPAATWKRAMNAALDRCPERLSYDDPQGSKRLRMALQGYLWRARTIRCEPEQIIVVNGSQQGLDLCARLLLDAGDRFVVEDPCYAMARHTFTATGASPVSVPVDELGLDTERLAGVEARLAYVTPSHQFPVGAVMPVSRRHRLLEWARDVDAYLVEDDYDSEYRYDISPVPPLHAVASGENVIYLGTVSKTLSPTLRIGYLVVPPELQAAFAAAKQLSDRHSPLNEQEALAMLIESGAYERHVRRSRRLNHQRRETLLNTLRRSFDNRIEIVGADAGLHVVVWFKGLPRHWEKLLIERSRDAKVGIHLISPLYDPTVGACPDRVGLVMGYAAMDVKRIEQGVHLLASIIKGLAKN